MYICLDTETGGIGLDKSLLSLAIVCADDNLNIVAKELVLDIMPDDKVFRCTGESLEINKINLVEHTKIAKTYKEAGTILYNFLFEIYDLPAKPTNPPGPPFRGSLKKSMLVGKNVYFDCMHVWDKLIKRATWEMFVSHQIIDVTGLWSAAVICNKVPVLPKTSLSAIAEYFNIPISSLHTAKGDAVLAFQCFAKLVEIFKGPLPGSPKTEVDPAYEVLPAHINKSEFDSFVGGLIKPE